MANKIIRLGSSSSSSSSTSSSSRSSSSQGIYTDIDLKAKPFMPIKLYSGEYLESEENREANSFNILIENTEQSLLLNDYNTTPIQQQYRVARSVNVKAIFNSIQNLFSFIPGERILFPEFGNKLYQHLYRGILDHNVEQITAEINRVCSTWENRISVQKIQNISSVEDTEDNIVRLNIVFTIPGIDDTQYDYSFTCNTVT